MKRIITLLILVIAIGIGGWLWYSSTHLFTTDTSPSNGNTNADTLQPVSITFNHSLQPNVARDFTITPAVQGDVSIKGAVFTFTPTTAYQLNTTYTAVLAQPVSQSGLYGGDVSIQFKVSYINYSNLSKKQQQEHLDRTDSIQRENPVLQYLPHETLDYKIEYSITPTNQISLLISLYGIYNRPSQAASYQHQLMVDQQEALGFLASKGVSPTKYPIVYTPPIASTQPALGD